MCVKPLPRRPSQRTIRAVIMTAPDLTLTKAFTGSAVYFMDEKTGLWKSRAPGWKP